jgi:tetratricopeptide (TPR) repeat protein
MPDKAIENFQRARELKPDYMDTYLQLGLLYAQKKDRRAGQYYTTALRIDPGNMRALYARGIYYQEIDSANLAIKDYEKILDLAPEFLSTNLNLGYIYLQRKDYEKAVKYFTDAIDNNPSSKEAYDYRSQAYKALNKPDLAKEDADKAKEIEKTREREQ